MPVPNSEINWAKFGDPKSDSPRVWKIGWGWVLGFWSFSLKGRMMRLSLLVLVDGFFAFVGDAFIWDL